MADLVQMGRTFEESDLSVVGTPILVAQSLAVADAPTVRMFMQRVCGILLTREYIMVEYDCSRAFLEEACAITPGIESPTLAPLNSPNWVSVKAMAKQSAANQIMDALKVLGAKDILVTDIRTCRI